MSEIENSVKYRYSKPMQLIADLHLHSKYSRATSKELDLFGLYRWCLKKGISLVGTADFTHPRWFVELKQHLEPAAAGLYKLKSQITNSPTKRDLAPRGKSQINSKNQNLDFKNEPYYVLTSEISCIYTQNGKMRRIHLVLLAPSLETVEKVNKALAKRGNLFSDGRPIFGMSAYELAKTVWDIDQQIILIPAHVWTPWFSLYGSMSGFDSLEECFGDLSDRMYAIETGLSSDPPMNWRLSQLDRVSIVSFGDGHSGGNLMREATIFELPEPSFSAIAEALRNSSAAALSLRAERNNLHGIATPRQSGARDDRMEVPHIVKTIEFYPEEGKYHYDGHRLCGIRFSPQESRHHKNVCPQCHRPLTIGVMNRVEQLADRPEGYVTQFRPPFQSLVQLSQIIAEAFGKPEASMVVKDEYQRLVSVYGNEYTILVDASEDDLTRGPIDRRILEGVMRVRDGKIQIEPGYDGAFGKVTVFLDKQNITQRSKVGASQQTLF